MRSIAMTTYNGEKFIERQIDSILSQMKDDELVISDDGSTDNTLEILRKYATIDGRIKITYGPKSGVVKNFEHAIKNCKGEIIFIADQDDEWFPNKLEIISEEFKQLSDNVKLIMHNGISTNHKGELIIQSYLMKHGVIRNIFRSCYYGHRMAFRKDLAELCIPFPDSCPAYDQFIGVISEINKSSYFINDMLTNHIIHDANVSRSLSFIKKVNHRILLLRSILHSIRKR